MKLQNGVYKSKIDGHKFNFLSFTEGDLIFQSQKTWKLYKCQPDAEVLNYLEFVMDRFEYLYGVNGTITKGDK